MEYSFIFSPGRWLGKGTISIQGAIKPLNFYIRWQINQINEKFSAMQTVEIDGVPEHVVTSYIFTDITEKTFVVELNSDSIGQAIGKGVIASDTIAWEYHSPQLEGFEIYKRLDNDHYSLHAEYSSNSQYRTTIEGTLWKT